MKAQPTLGEDQITTAKRKMRRSKKQKQMQKYSGVRHALRIFYWCLILGIIGVVGMMAWEIFTTYHEGTRSQ